jgi:endo-1,4-beta-xylanase
MERKTKMFHYAARKRFLVIPFTLFLLTIILITGTGQASAASTLGSAAAAKGRVFGTSIQASLLNSNAQYTSTFDTQFNGVTPENEMKWATTEPSRNSFNFGSADQIVSHAQSHGMKIRGHTLVWHSQLAGWVSSLTGASNVLSAMNNHITQEMTHFKGKIWYWDVVNEAFNDDGTRRSDVFQNQIGNAYIEDAFRTARTADPSAKLCYNDFNIEGMNAKSNAVFSMVQDFKSRGVPIDCVGFQSHFIVGQVPSTFQANMQRFANLGVDVQITELDDRMPTPASTANLNQQANDYRTVVTACLAVSRCTDITVWGVDDGHSWVPNTFSGQGAALLFDANFQKKPAYNSTLQALGG